MASCKRCSHCARAWCATVLRSTTCEVLGPRRSANWAMSIGAKRRATFGSAFRRRGWPLFNRSGNANGKADRVARVCTWQWLGNLLEPRAPTRVPSASARGPKPAPEARPPRRVRLSDRSAQPYRRPLSDRRRVLPPARLRERAGSRKRKRSGSLAVPTTIVITIGSAGRAPDLSCAVQREMIADRMELNRTTPELALKAAGPCEARKDPRSPARRVIRSRFTDRGRNGPANSANAR